MPNSVRPVNSAMSNVESSTLLEIANQSLLRHAGPFDELLVERASGTMIWDREGNEYLDFTSGQLCATFGHNPGELRDAMLESFQRAVHSSSLLLSEEVILLAQDLLELLPPNLSKVTLLSTGSEATEVGLKAAKMATGRWETIGVSRSYHGHTAGAAGVTFLPRRQGSGPGQPGVHSIPAPYCFRCPLGATYPECGFACVDVGMDTVDTQRTSEIAACIIEPILSTGGMIEPPVGYLEHLRQRCDEQEVLLILDEAQTGLGRTGDMFAFESSGVVPDVVALSKSLGGGFPLAAVAITDTIAEEAERNGLRFLTSHMNEPSMALIGLAMLTLAKEHVQAGSAAKQGKRLESALDELMDESETVGDVRGRGLLLGVEFVIDRTGQEAAPEIASRVAATCRRRGLLVQVVAGNVWRIAPPITVSDDEIDRAVSIIRDSLEEDEHA
ncbi:MAG: aspartate aminotransferase family protein [Actinomycetia bacterium]|nr:aspartate aminotransferase family protein [Actinomycetes bacterium]